MKNYAIPLLFFLNMIKINAQQLVSTAAAQGTSASGIQYSWSIGEIAIATISNDKYAVTQGQQQPYIKNRPPFDAYNGITIDGNPENKVFRVKNIEEFPNNSIVIVNRWGEIIYKKENYDNEWEGRDANGTPLETGTYYYIFYPDKTKSTHYKGNIFIINQ
jgi:gliding motility-associated-like protein